MSSKTAHDNDFKKISLETGEIEIEKNHKAMKAASKRGIPKALRIFLMIVSIILVIFASTVGFFYIRLNGPVRKLYAQVQDFQQTGRELVVAARDQNIDQAKEKLGEVRTKLTDMKATYDELAWLKSFPFVKNYMSDGDHMFTAGFAGLDAGDKAIAAIEPNADLLGLKGGNNFVAGSADERIQIAVKTMRALTPQINEISKDIEVMRTELDAIDVNRYPEELRGKKIREPIMNARETFDSFANLFVNAQPLLVRLPDILGDPKTRRYLVVFQNDKELRPTGGFLTAFAQFRFEKGKAILERSDDIYKLDDALRKKYPVPDEILTYHKNVKQFYIRDSNLSPDFKLSMDQFYDMYQNTNGSEDIDGIIAMDTNVVVEILKVLGPIYVSGREFSAENDPRCDCPKAVYELEDYSTRPVNYVRTERKDIIGDLMEIMLRTVLGTSPSKYWGTLFQVGIDQINQKHILAYFLDEDEQKAVEAFNMAGRIMTSEDTSAIFKYSGDDSWDYLHVNHANMAGQKANLFTQESFTKDVTVNDDGTIQTVLTVDYKNPFPGSDCGLESGGLCLNAPLRNWVRVYVPKGSKLVESKGSISPKTGDPEEMNTYDSLDKTVFEGFLIVNPQGIAKLQVTYTSPVKVDGQYKLLIQKQPGTKGQEFLLKLNGQDRKKFTLDTDMELSL